MRRILLAFYIFVILVGLSCSYFPIQHTPISLYNLEPIIIQPNEVKTYFTKQDQHPETALINLYNNSKTSLDIASYSLTYPDIIKSILSAHKREVKVRVISDKVQSAGNTQKHAINSLIEAGIPVKINSHSGLMHLKMSIIDNSIATTGSYNYTTNATSNNDEMLVIINNIEFTKACSSEFERMWNNLLKYIPAQITY